MQLTEQQLAELNAMAERFMDTDLGLALSNGCLDLIADLEEARVTLDGQKIELYEQQKYILDLQSAIAEAVEPYKRDAELEREHGEVDHEAIAPKTGSLITDQRMAELAREGIMTNGVAEAETTASASVAGPMMMQHRQPRCATGPSVATTGGASAPGYGRCWS